MLLRFNIRRCGNILLTLRKLIELADSHADIIYHNGLLCPLRTFGPRASLCGRCYSHPLHSAHSSAAELLSRRPVVEKAICGDVVRRQGGSYSDVFYSQATRV